MRVRSSWSGTAAAGALAVALLVTAGCSSSGDATDDASEATSTSAAADTTTSTVAAGPIASDGCGTSEQAAVKEQEQLLDVGGASRRYLLTVPEAHDGTTPLPIVFDFHGLLETADIETQMSGYSALAEQEGFVVVFPNGTGNPIKWDVDADDSNPDLTYFDAVLDEVESSLCIDESRVYATGLSMGAMFTSVLLCERADVLAAAAPVAGLIDPDGCSPSRPVPILTFHGTEDPILLFNGGVDLSGIGLGGGGDGNGAASTTTTAPPADLDGEGFPANVATWAARNGCDADATDTDVSDEVIQRVYDCPAGADVEFDIVVGGGHAWPGSEFSQQIESVVGYTTFDVDATHDGWAFMSQFTNDAAG